MRFITLSIALITILSAAQAQTNKLKAGTKIALTEISDLHNKSTVMGTDVEVISKDTITRSVVIKSIKDSVITLNCTTRRMRGSMSALDQAQSFDSNDTSLATNPAFASILKTINKEESLLLINGKLIKKDSMMSTSVANISKILSGNGSISYEFVAQLFLPTEAKNKKEGYKWAGEEINKDSSIKSETIYTISKVTPEETEVSATTSYSFSGTMHVMEMDLKQSIAGKNTTVYKYHTSNGLLISGTVNTVASGTGEIMGNSIPINLKGTSGITVQ